METESKFGFGIFFVIVIVIIVGGFYFMKKTDNTNKNNETVNNQVEENVDIRLDNTKEYIYFSNSNTVVDELDIVYQDVNLNFDASQDITSDLNKENAEFSKSLKYDDTWEDDSYDKLVYAKFKKNTVYTFNKYLSLVVDYYEFDRDNLVTYLSTSTFVFNKNTGNLYTEDELLSEFNLTKDDVLDKVKEYVEDQDVLKDDENLDADATVNNISTLNLYVDKLGRLNISVLVKSDQKDYNESIILS